MPAHAATWARRQAFGIHLDKPGIEDHHFVCAGYYNCTETGFGDVVRPRHHVWAVTKYEYDKGIRSDCRAPAYEPMLVTHIECSADGLSIFVFGRVLLNWPRLKLYQGAQKLPKIMQRDSRLFVYSDWEVAATADTGGQGWAVGEWGHGGCAPRLHRHRLVVALVPRRAARVEITARPGLGAEQQRRGDRAARALEALLPQVAKARSRSRGQGHKRGRARVEPISHGDQRHWPTGGRGWSYWLVRSSWEHCMWRQIGALKRSGCRCGVGSRQCLSHGCAA